MQKSGTLTPTDKPLSRRWNDKMAFQTTSNIPWHFMINIQPQQFRSWSLRIINKKLFDIQKTASAVALIEGRITLPYISGLKKAARTPSKPLFCHWFVTFQPINGIWNIIKHLKRYVFRRPHN